MNRINKYMYLGLALLCVASIIAATVVVTSMLIYNYLVKFI